MPVYAGIECTEIGTTELRSFPGVTAGAAIGPAHVANIGGTPIGVYNINDANLAASVGPPRQTDHTLLQQARVKLTNDVRWSEWKIEGHNPPHPATTALMITNVTADIATLYNLRQQLANLVTAQQAAFPADKIILAPNATVNLRAPSPEGVFLYRPGLPVEGKAQITVQYTNFNTISRICLLNASK